MRVFSSGALVARTHKIDVQRINVREPDRTLRMVVFSKAAAPGVPWRGKEIAHQDRQSSAGIASAGAAIGLPV